jgi:hypothetical protein
MSWAGPRENACAVSSWLALTRADYLAYNTPQLAVIVTKTSHYSYKYTKDTILTNTQPRTWTIVGG